MCACAVMHSIINCIIMPKKKVQLNNGSVIDEKGQRFIENQQTDDNKQ